MPTHPWQPLDHLERVPRIWRGVIYKPLTYYTGFVYLVYGVARPVSYTALPFFIDLHITVPDGRSCCWFIESTVFFLFFTQTRFIPGVTLNSTVAFTASIYLHPRSLRA